MAPLPLCFSPVCTARPSAALLQIRKPLKSLKRAIAKRQGRHLDAHAVAAACGGGGSDDRACSFPSVWLSNFVRHGTDGTCEALQLKSCKLQRVELSYASHPVFPTM